VEHGAGGEGGWAAAARCLTAACSADCRLPDRPGMQLGDAGRRARLAPTGERVLNADVDCRQHALKVLHASTTCALHQVIRLPGRVRASSAQALMTLHGQLYVRVNDR
jgi:hypothetical protein